MPAQDQVGADQERASKGNWEIAPGLETGDFRRGCSANGGSMEGAGEYEKGSTCPKTFSAIRNS
jgi:hypothetical protein